MDNLIKPEVLIPIIISLILAIITYFYLMETKAARIAMVKQFEVLKRQHFVSTAPFLYASNFEKVEGTDNYRITITNPSDKLAREIRFIVYESEKKTFRIPSTSKVVMKPDAESDSVINGQPYVTDEVKKYLSRTYGIPNEFPDTLFQIAKNSYILLFYTDIEGSLYSVKSFYTWNEEGKFQRQPSKFKKIYDPRNSSSDSEA